MRLPGLPNTVSVVPTLSEQIPAVRHLLVRRLGHEGTEFGFAALLPVEIATNNAAALC